MSVQSLVSDPEFLRLSPADQQATLAQMDSGFGKLRPQDFAATVFELQKRSISANPPATTTAAKPAPMQESALGYLPGAGTLNPAPQTTNYQAVPQEQTTQGYQAAVQQRAADQPVINASGNVAIGAGKAGGESIHTLGALAGELLPDSVDNQIGLPTSFTEPDYLKSENGYQSAGKVAETIAEFILGDTALKGLTIAEKLGLAQKTVKLAQDSPYIAKFLEIGMNAIRQAGVGMGQGLLHGEDIGDAAKTGAITGVVGLGAGAVGEVLGAGAESAASREGKLLAEPVPGETENILRNGAQNTIKDATGDVPMNYRLPRGGPTSIRSVFEDASEQVQKHAQGLFDQIDAATENRLSAVQKQLRAIELAKRGAWSDEQVAQLQAQQATAEAMQEKLFEQAKTNGVAPEVIDNARAAWKQSAALADLDHAVKMSTKGMRPELNGGPDTYTPETIDPKMLFQRMNKLYDSGRLQEAFGGDVTHVKNIMHVLDLAQQPKNVGVLQQLTTELVKRGAIMMVGGFVGYERAGLTGAVSGSVAGAAAPVVLGKMLSSPLAMHIISTGLENGQSVTKIAPAVANAMQVEK